jgi:hypothetical protein
MSLSTCGAVMGFAGEFIDHSLHDFEKAAQQIKDRTLKGGIEIFIRDEEKYSALMEKTRRENRGETET